MTENTLAKGTNKDCGNDINNTENILNRFVDSNGIHLECGHYHGFNPKTENVRT